MQQRKQHGSAGVPEAEWPAAGERSASSVSRKRGHREAGCSEGPASVKKRSPEVGSRGQSAAQPHAGQREAMPAVAAGRSGAADIAATTGLPPARDGTAFASVAGMAAAKPKLQREHGRQKVLQGHQEVAGLSAHKGSTQPAHAAAEGASSKPGCELVSPLARPGKLIIPVVLQHSPPQQRRQQPLPAAAQPPTGAAATAAVPEQEQQQSLSTRNAAEGAEDTLAKPARQQEEVEEQAATKPAAQAGLAGAAATGAGACEGRPAQPAAAVAPKQVPRPLRAPLLDDASPRQELPSLSQWVDARGRSLQQQHGRQQRSIESAGSQELEMPSTSVLVAAGGAGQEPQCRSTTSPGKRQPSLQPPQPQPQREHQQAQVPPQPVTRTPPTGDDAATAAPTTISAAQAITPRLRAGTLEPPRTAVCLRDDPHGGHCSRASRMDRQLSVCMAQSARPAWQLFSTAEDMTEHAAESAAN